MILAAVHEALGAVACRYAAQLNNFSASRLLKKSFASTGKDGVVALSKDSSTSIVPSSSSSADPSPEISSHSGVDHPLPADQLAFYRDAHVDVASSLGARTRL